MPWRRSTPPTTMRSVSSDTVYVPSPGTAARQCLRGRYPVDRPPPECGRARVRVPNDTRRAGRPPRVGSRSHDVAGYGVRCSLLRASSSPRPRRTLLASGPHDAPGVGGASAMAPTQTPGINVANAGVVPGGRAGGVANGANQGGTNGAAGGQGAFWSPSTTEPIEVPRRRLDSFAPCHVRHARRSQFRPRFPPTPKAHPDRRRREASDEVADLVRGHRCPSLTGAYRTVAWRVPSTDDRTEASRTSSSCPTIDRVLAWTPRERYRPSPPARDPSAA